MGFDGMGDRVSRALPKVRLDSLGKLIDVELFQARLSEVESDKLSESEAFIVRRFREGAANGTSRGPSSSST
jgi:hypothetical protein